MRIDSNGVVMNNNHDRLPHGCAATSGEQSLTVRAGTGYAEDAPGMIFGMSRHEVRAQPCERLTVTFINEDQVRHQWMVHGLPKYLYPAGMFHLEANAGKTVTGTFIVPADDRTYLIHCDMAQHMEKGMKGQLVVGSGSGNLWSVKGIGDPFTRSTYLPGWWPLPATALILGGMFLGLKVARSR
jgi:plastocyanin